MRGLRPGSAGGRPDGAGGAARRRARRAGRAGGGRGGPGGRSWAAARRRAGGRVRQPARRILAGAAGRPRAHRRGRRRTGRRGPGLLRADARCGPGRRADRTGGPGRAGRRAAAPVPLAGGDRHRRAVERAAARALRLLLHHRAGDMLAAAGLAPRSRLALRAVRRHRAAGRPAGRRRGQRAGPRRRPGRAVRALPIRTPGRASRTRPCWPDWAQRAARAEGLRDWLAAEHAAGRRVLGYGAASRAVALLLPGRGGPAAAARGGRRIAGQAGPAGCPARISRSSARTSWPRTSRTAVLLFLVRPAARGPARLPGGRGRRRPLGGRGPRWPARRACEGRSGGLEQHT